MNEENQLASGFPELTEEQRLELEAIKQQELSTDDRLMQQIMQESAQVQQPSIEATAPVEPAPQIEPIQEQPEAVTPEPEQPADDEFTGINLGNQILDENLPENTKAALAMGVGLLDTTAGLLNLIPKVEVPTVPEFQNEVTQTIRELSSVLLPMLALQGYGTAALASKASKAKHFTKLLNDPFTKWLGSTAFGAGSGALVDYVVPFNETDDNLAGTLKQTWPRFYGWIPDDIATLDSDSPDQKRGKNVLEGAGLGLTSDLLLGLAKFASAKYGAKIASKWIPESEKAEYFFKRHVVIDDTVEDVVERSARKRAEALDELGTFNFERSVDPDKPIFGYHDLYGYEEMGIRSADDLGIIGASVDAARIFQNIDTVYGRVGSVFTDAALKFGLESTYNEQVIIKGLAETLKEAGEYGYQTASGKYLSHVQIVSRGDDIAADLADMEIGEMQEYIKAFTGTDVNTGVTVLNDEGYAGVFKAIRTYMDDFMQMDELRARGYLATSLAGQISDMSQSVRLGDGGASIQRAQEMVLDRIEFLMSLKGQTSYARGRALNHLNLWNRMTMPGSRAYDAAEARRIAKAIEGEKNPTLAAIERFKTEAKETVDNLRVINDEAPEMLAPIMMAYEFTDGNVKTIHSLNQYFRKSTAVLSKAFVDLDKKVPSVIIDGFFANVYNSTLSAFSTPIKALISGSHLLIEKPIRTFAGAALNWDTASMRRGWYQYSNMMDAVSKSTEYMGQIFKRSALDPYVIDVRDNVGLRNIKQLEILNAFADAKAAKGEFGPQVLMQQVSDMNDLANHPWLRFGTRSMQAMDGFVQSMVASFETKGRIFDDLTAGGTKPFDATAAKQLETDAYKAVFDKEGIIRDSAVQNMAGEISMNLDNPLNDGISNMISTFPILKSFVLFTKTPLNELALAASYSPLNPMNPFLKDMVAFAQPVEEVPLEKIKELLSSKGVKVTSDNYRTKYNEFRNDIKGRRAIGSILVGSAAGLFLNDRLTGSGHYNRQVQAARRELDWKPRSIKGFDGKWYSYDGLGPVTAWLTLTADIMDNFDSISPDGVQENLKKMTYILAASLVDKTMLAGLQPFLDVVRGDGGAINKWGASFLTAATVRGSSQMAELARLMEPGLKEVGNDIKDLSFNRLPGLKSTLPDTYDWIDGGKVTIPEGIFARFMNTYTPWKISGEISKEKQYLIDIEFDARPTLRTDGKGNEFTNEQRSEILNIIGKDKLFKTEIQRVMKMYPASKFKSEYNRAKGKMLNPDKDTFSNVHVELDFALRAAIKSAIGRSSSFTSIQQKAYVQNTVRDYMQRGLVDEADRFLTLMEQQFSK